MCNSTTPPALPTLAEGDITRLWVPLGPLQSDILAICLDPPTPESDQMVLCFPNHRLLKLTRTQAAQYGLERVCSFAAFAELCTFLTAVAMTER